ncbi:response regulator [Actinomadura keratinilytica]
MRIVLAEDLHLLREGLIHMLTVRGMEVVAAVETGEELRRALREQTPDVAIVDVRLPPTFTDEGLQAALAARRETPGLPVLVLSQHVEQLYARELLADGVGAVGYLLKDRVLNGDQFVEAVRRVAERGTAMDPDVIAKLLASSPHQEPFARLTPREREVLALMAEGRSNAAIAQRLFLSEGAISKYTTAIFQKLGIGASEDGNRRVLAVLAYLHGTGSGGAAPAAPR